MNRVVYFAYGSNMSRRRLQARAPSAEFLGIGVLACHALAFHKVSSKDGSGKCDIVPSASKTVYGVLFRLAEPELPQLDAHEGVGEGYERRRVSVQDDSRRQVRAWTDIATRIDPRVHPDTWYKRHVLEGAREARLPLAYVQRIEAAAAVDDPDTARVSRELAIYA